MRRLPTGEVKPTLIMPLFYGSFGLSPAADNITSSFNDLTNLMQQASRYSKQADKQLQHAVAPSSPSPLAAASSAPGSKQHADEHSSGAATVSLGQGHAAENTASRLQHLSMSGAAAAAQNTPLPGSSSGTSVGFTCPQLLKMAVGFISSVYHLHHPQEVRALTDAALNVLLVVHSAI